jgi:parvulin-like peptidyl-prolyl isomerase
MIRFLNKRFRVLLLVALAVLGVSFVFFGDWSSGGGTQANPVVMRIADDPVTAKEFKAGAADSSMLFFLRTGQSPDNIPQASAMIQSATWQRFLINGFMQSFGLETTDEQYLDYLHSHPSFQKDGEFDPAAFGQFFNNFLNPQGIRDERFERAVRSMLLQDEAVSLVRSTAVVLPEDVERATLMQYGTVVLQAVEIDRQKLASALKPTEDDLNAFYQNHSNRFMVPEARQFEIVSFTLSPEQMKLEEEARQEALSTLGEKAYAFTEPFYNARNDDTPYPDWQETVKAAGVEVKETGWLTPASKDYLPSILREIFKLTPEQPVTSDYLRTEDGYLIFRLKEIRPPEAKPYDQVKSEVRSMWIEENTNQKLQEAAIELNNRLLDALAEGTSLSEAVKETPHQITRLDAFVPAGDTNPPEGPLANQARSYGSRLNVGELSRPTPTATGVAFFYLESREEPAAEIIEANRDQIRAQLEAMNQRMIIEAWISDLMDSPGTDLPDGLVNRGS